MKEVSHALAEMQRKQKIMYYYKFPETKSASLVVSDHFIIKNDKTVIFIEEKSSKNGKLQSGNVFGDNKLHQVVFNKLMQKGQNKACYLFRFNNRNKITYCLIWDINSLNTKYKSYISADDFTIKDSSLEKLLEQVVS